jgi:hypothetical protein
VSRVASATQGYAKPHSSPIIHTCTSQRAPSSFRYADKYRARTVCTPTTPEFCGGAAYAAKTGNTANASEEQLARKVSNPS